MRGYIQTRMEQMGQFVAEASVAQKHSLASASAGVQAHKAKKESDASGLRDQVREGSESV